MMTAALMRGARGLLGWSQSDLAAATGLSLPTIKRMEGPIGPGRSSADNVTAVRRAFENAGIEFIPENGGGEGVRFRQRRGDRQNASESNANEQ